MAYIDSSLAALGDPTRLAIFHQIAARPQSVGEIAETVPVSRPAVSQHLKVLRDAGLVEDTKEGTRRVYRARAEAIEALRQYFDGIWARNLQSFQAEAERRRADGTDGSDRRGTKGN